MILFVILFLMTLLFASIMWYNLVFLPANPPSVYLPPKT